MNSVQSTRDHRLMLRRIGLVGGHREVTFRPGLNLITGPISTGKTTLIRLIEVALSAKPADLPPETADVRALELDVRLRNEEWGVYRPLVSTADAPIELALLDDEGEQETAVSVPAAGFKGSYSRFLLDHLGLPAIAIPEGTAKGGTRMNPVSMSDWLNYCIIRGEDLDSTIFGHGHPFRDKKRRYVFSLVYGLHDAELAKLTAQIKSIELQLTALETEEITITKFLSGTPFSNVLALEAEVTTRQELLDTIDREEQATQAEADDSASEIRQLREQLLAARRALAMTREGAQAIRYQISELDELERQLTSQSARLTRAIVADEWLVDFDFMVCPRCGTEVLPTASDDTCYLCHQVPNQNHGRDSLIAEQSRVASQIDETSSLNESRRADLAAEETRIDLLSKQELTLGRDLDRASDRFVSDRASLLQSRAAQRARLESEINKLREYSELFRRRQDRGAERSALEERLQVLETEAVRRKQRASDAEDRVQALERRTLEYLEKLHIPHLADLLTVRINRTTFLPEVSARTFDELSSQGLKTLVNVAHALAHHTVAIDLGLPLPGLLVLDGISANAGHEGFDQARIDDLYVLLREEAAKYAERLQVIVVDNTIPASALTDLPPIVLELSHEDRLIRAGSDLSEA